MPETLQEEKSVRSWPVDALGNEIRKGALVHIKIPEGAIICRVADVVQAGVLHDADGKPMQLDGSVTFVVRIPYPVGGGLPQTLVLKEPVTQ